ncbi:MAG: DUF4291 domain-containing protein [Microcoleus sp. PH2017_10_PVI_O_A]|uniref:DUF4291 domain-containing protein n=1 Tax=unclassified Microcoleus TaxID=2642155 RepID=UPI001DE34BA0|nr:MULTISPECIES: DUF4291 domain-containing protein [unclassified Microcoleus]TAE79448.1 MAG: DUF4291 domain-containing protein [Oscillatoriales cyanobacterium]MCC3408258.1 DUF4291 domain-containing protein [Microcoleus sp. PH2017_10_PVI_O_A]MCC3461650.1 DUF4291 domain-containing protein [Microcoleus sp. PH2017_11_PCY_U_A]MCC3480828.1 DUF4291 domain-containing protein [Microcoleus sp. PH2017_12_PCY_D_A]MCC3528949.1 DUF4291 domain-containing protein [Microcoleus sp. PH2017_21_RUC_O_A]
MKLLTESYLNQKIRWPNTGRHILAQFDDDTVVVYQAYRPAIGLFAAENGYFGGEFSLNRMSWIKPNFLWMMYRSEWGTKPGQEIILAIWLKRSAFDEILASAVHSNFVSQVYGSEKQWKQAVKNSLVRLQWDPDHHPSGAKLERRAIQLGLRGSFLANYAREWIVNIEDISQFVRQQHEYKGDDRPQLLTPRETVYPVTNPDICQRLGVAISPTIYKE